MDEYEVLSYAIIVQALHDLASPDVMERRACISDIHAGGLDGWVEGICSPDHAPRILHQLREMATKAMRKPLTKLSDIQFPLQDGLLQRRRLHVDGQ